MLRTLHLPVRASCPPFPSCQRRSHPGSLMPGLNPAWHCQASAAFAMPRTAGHRRWGIKSCPSQTPPVPPGSAWPRDVTNCIPDCRCLGFPAAKGRDPLEMLKRHLGFAVLAPTAQGAHPCRAKRLPGVTQRRETPDGSSRQCRASRSALEMRSSPAFHATR